MVIFKACPDCGHMNDRLRYERTYFSTYGGDTVSQDVYVECPTCNWRTNTHKNVSECAEQWNNAGLNEVMSDESN